MTSSALDLLALSRPATSIATQDAPLRIETITDLESFTRMEDQWNELLEESRADSIFLTWEWLHTWWTHLAGGRRLSIVTASRGHDLVAIAPFALRRRKWFGLSALEFLGTGQVGSDYLDVIIRRGHEGETLPILTVHPALRSSILDLRQLHNSSSAGRRLAVSLAHSGGLIRATATNRCPFIDLRGLSFETYLGSLGSEHRQNFRRRLKKLETGHRLRFEQVWSEARRRELLPILYELHRLRWVDRGGDGLAGPGIHQFHDDFTRMALGRGWLRLFVLWLGDVPAAAIYGFRRGSVFSFYQSGFDPRFSKLSVGLVAMGLTIRRAIEEGASEFDLLHGEEPYKFHWAFQTRRLDRVVCYPPGMRGCAACFASALVHSMRGLKHGLKRALWGTAPAEGMGDAHAATIR